MRKYLALLLTAALTLLPLSALAAPGAPVSARVLVGFKGPPDPGLVRSFGGQVTFSYRYMPVLAACLPEAAVAALAGHPAVAYVEPDGTVEATGQVLPWGVDRIDADLVWPLGHTGQGIKVAILDTGIDGGHADLQVHGGYNFIGNNDNWQDDNGHGTHVAGTAAALDNTLDVVGVAPAARLYAVKVLDAAGSGSYSTVAAGIEWAITHGMQAINMSLGGSSSSETLKTACDNAYAAGILLVASAGNSGNPAGRGDNIGYPAAYASVIAVGATTSNDTRASYSSTGPALELMAPGSSVLSTKLGGGTTTMSGTSMASPHVAGVAALVWAANTALTNVQLRTLLNETAEPIGDGDPLKYGNGLVDAEAAVGAATGGSEPPPPEPGDALVVAVTTDKTAYRMGETIYITVSVTDTSGLPVGEAAVSVEVLTASGRRSTASGTTGGDGRAYFQYKTKRPDGTGSYTISASADKTGYTSGSASTSVTVD